MAEISPGAALRELQRAQAGMRKARQAMRQVRGGSARPEALRAALRVGWESLAEAHRILGAVPLDAATDPVLTKQLAVQRYATALLVRLRRLVRNEDVGDDQDDDLGDSE